MLDVECSRYIALNAVGAHVWRQLDRHRTQGKPSVTVSYIAADGTGRARDNRHKFRASAIFRISGKW
ncbi:PqqD family protein [Sphingorhabdus sp. 109]|uniref:PqqD family protein n=1 Tax=Sphingorhabdus sp. 109 TaxID=2653173 RepID=UPI0012EF4C85|nr:hypothetical protein SPHINGOR109_50108 [Sphingorhabdus sp. 109]